jgi:MFS family permease
MKGDNCMRKKEPKEVLNGFSWVYMFFAIVGIICAIIVPLIPAIPEAFKQAMNDGRDPIVFLETNIIVRVLIDLLYFYLLRQYTSGKSKGTLLIVLLVIGLVGNLVSMFTTKGTSTLNLIINAVVLYYALKARK